MTGRWIDIPTEFQSLYYEGMFPQCVDCERPLLDGQTLYWVERVFRGTEPICEMAICLDCKQRISGELSQDSMMRIGAHVEERFDIEQRYSACQEWAGNSVERWLDRCILSKQQRSDCYEYQIAGMCLGQKLSLDVLPVMISGAAVEDLQKLMSKQTRDRLGEMVEDFFGMPGEFADGPDSKTPLLW